MRNHLEEIYALGKIKISQAKGVGNAVIAMQASSFKEICNILHGIRLDSFARAFPDTPYGRR